MQQTTSKRKARSQKAFTARWPRRRIAIAITVVMSLAACLMTLVHSGALGSAFSQKRAGSTQVSTASFDHNSPSKEYIYAGGKLIATEEPTSQSSTNDAAFVSQSVPGSMTAGQIYAVSVTISNTGTTTWSPGTYFLGSQNPPGNSTWGLTQVGLASSVAPSQPATFTFNVTAPASAGSYNFQWQMLQSGVGYFGAMTPNVVVSVTGGLTDNAGFISQFVQTPMTVNQTAAVSVTMLNTGTTTWTTDSYYLGSQNPAGNMTWGVNQVSLPLAVGPNQQVTFIFNITAPPVAGTYNFQWQMLHGATYFGALTTNVPVTVNPGSGDGATFVTQSVPSTLNTSQVVQVSVTMHNSGTTTWDTLSYNLGSQNPQDNMTWGLNRVSAKSSTSPGSDRQFVFNITAPTTPGVYNFQWRMIHATTWFGAFSQNIAITVGNPPTPPAAPSGLSATAISGNQINLAWSDNSNNEDGFKIERKTGAGAYSQIAIVGAGVTSYPDTTVSPSTTYTYRVRAYNGAGDSAYSNEASATTPGPPPPAAPSDLRASALSSTRVGLDWLDNSTNEDGFKIERKTGGGAYSQIGTVGANFTSYLDDTVVASTTYTYRVRAYNASGGDSAYSNEATVTTPADPTPPAAPSNLVATAVSSSQINLTWSDNSNNEDGFRIVRSSGGNFFDAGNVGPNVTSFSDINLLPSTTYTYKVQSYAGTLYSAFSAPASATTQASGGGGCPTVSVFSGGGTYGYAEGVGTAALWAKPVAGVVAKDPSSGLNSIFIADTENHRIRMIVLEGTYSGASYLIAGDGTAGYYDDPSTTKKSRFRYPRGIAAITDINGMLTTLLVADTDNNIIRKLWWTGGAWHSGAFSGATTAGYVDNNATKSRYNAPQGMVVASDGFIYLADTGNHVIRKLDQTGTSTTLVGAGTFTTPVGITASQGTVVVYVSDSGTHKIYQVTTAGVVTAIAGSGSAGFADGTGSSAMFNSPSQVAWANPTGGSVLYVADQNNNRLRKIVLATSVVSTYAGSGVAGFADGSCTVAQFNLLRGAAVGPSGEVYVVDTTNNRVRKVQ